MNMKLFGMIAITLLSVSLLSLAVVTFTTAHASPLSMIIPSGFYDDQLLGMVSMISIGMTLEIPKDSYNSGETIEISGQITDYNVTTSIGTSITILISTDNNPRVAFGQINPSDINSDGSYSYELRTGGPQWKKSDNYNVQVFFGGTDVRANKTIAFVSAEPEPPTEPPAAEPDPEPEPPAAEPDPEPEPPTIPPPPPPPCPPDTERVNGECIPVIPPPPEPAPAPVCGPGTELVDGICVPAKTPEPEPEPSGGGCLIATATYGTELAPQVQLLREIRDNTVMSTTSGTAFMTGFNQLYYSFSPAIADMERSNPAFQQTVRAFITPMIASLSIMTLAEGGSEIDVLGLGISVIALNIGMYIVAPTVAGITISRRIRSRRS